MECRKILIYVSFCKDAIPGNVFTDAEMSVLPTIASPKLTDSMDVVSWCEEPSPAQKVLVHPYSCTLSV